MQYLQTNAESIILMGANRDTHGCEVFPLLSSMQCALDFNDKAIRTAVVKPYQENHNVESTTQVYLGRRVSAAPVLTKGFPSSMLSAAFIKQALKEGEIRTEDLTVLSRLKIDLWCCHSSFIYHYWSCGGSAADSLDGITPQ